MTTDAQTFSDWSLVTFNTKDDPSDQTGAQLSDGSVVRIPSLSGAGGLMSWMDRWDEIAPELRTFNAQAAERVEDARILAPLRFPRKVVCAGANYRAHITEMGIELAEDFQGTPYFMLKPPSTSVIGPGDSILLPASGGNIDWEAELAVVIGKTAKNISAAEAPGVIAGYTILNDVSARAFLKQPEAIGPAFDFNWFSSKGLDTFAPMGPGIVPEWMIPDPHELGIKLWRNGNLMQDATTGGMLHNIWELISEASKLITLEPGDVLATGTPPGVAMATGDFLRDGDEVAIEIEGIGRLVNRVAQTPAVRRETAAALLS